MNTSSLPHRLAMGLATVAVAFSASLVTAPAAHAAFDCDGVVIDGAQSLDIQQEDSVARVAEIFPMNGLEIRIITTPNLTSEGEVVPWGEAGGGLNVDPSALQRYVLKMKDRCPGWSEPDEATGRLMIKGNLVIIAVAPSNEQLAYFAGDKTSKLDNTQYEQVMVQGIVHGYDSGQPESGFKQALVSLAWMLFWKQWMLMLAGFITVAALVTWAGVGINRHRRARKASRS